MKVKIYGKKYDIDEKLATTSRHLLEQVLDQVKGTAELNMVPQFYTAFIVTMYVTSSSILRELNVDKLLDLVEQDKKENSNDAGSQAGERSES